jgi:serine O-acetyltransferase
MFKSFKADLFRYSSSSSFWAFLKTWFSEPSFRYVFYFRLVSYYGKGSIRGLFFRYLLRRCSFKFGIQIPVGTTIGKGFYIGHFGNIIINKNTVIGSNINIANGVTIGQANRGKLEGTPVIGSSVWIGANAVIVGKIKIGDDVLIAPGAYVNFDVPDHSIVIGNPGEIHFNNCATEGYINKKI